MRKRFDAAKVLEIQKFLPPNDSVDNTYQFVNIPSCFPMLFGYHVVQGPIYNQTTADILNHIS